MLLVPSAVFVENSVMVAPEANVKEVSKVTAPVTSNSPVMFVLASNSIVPVPPGLRCNLALLGVLISLSLNSMLSMVAVPVIVGDSICGEENVFAVLSSPYSSAKLAFILSNAVRSGSPVPSLALVPMFIVNCAMLIIYPKFYKPDVILCRAVIRCRVCERLLSFEWKIGHTLRAAP